MRKLRHRRMTPGEVKEGQWYRWHKHLWYVRNVSTFLTSGGVTGGWVIIRCRGTAKTKTVDLEKFAARARRDYWLDRWRHSRLNP